MVCVCDGKVLFKGDFKVVYMFWIFGSEVYEIWNVVDFLSFVFIMCFVGLKDIYKSWWECGIGIVFFVLGVLDWCIWWMM